MIDEKDAVSGAEASTGTEGRVSWDQLLDKAVWIGERIAMAPVEAVQGP